MTRKTILNDSHRALGAKMVDFGGWDMPIHYGSQIEEHHQVRRDAGMFDVSHMTVVDLKGARVRDFLRHLLANSVDKLKKPGKALYTCMLNERGGVIDDLIVYFMDESFFRLVVNAATREKDLAWITAQAESFDVTVTERPDFGMVAVQGPAARDKVVGLLREADRERIGKLGKFVAAEAKLADGTDLFIARTGYTGEDGFEIVVAEDRTIALWDALLAAFNPQPTTPSGAQKPREDAAPWTTRVGAIELRDAGAAFTDRRLEPALEVELQQLNARARGYGAKPGAAMPVQVDGRIKGGGTFAAAGGVDPRTLATDLKVKLNGLPLTSSRIGP